MGSWSGLRSELLMSVQQTPLCAPGLFDRFKPIVDLSALLDFTLIHTDVSFGTGLRSEWQEWLSSFGANQFDCSHGLSFKDPSLALLAAIDGLGIAM